MDNLKTEQVIEQIEQIWLDLERMKKELLEIAYDLSQQEV